MESTFHSSSDATRRILVKALAFTIFASAPCLSEPGQRILLVEAGSDSNGKTPQRREIGTIDGAQRIAVPENGGHLLVLRRDGKLQAWGDNSHGQLGTGDMEPAAGWREVEGLDQVVAIAAGPQHSVALRADGTVWTWGGNFGGQLGDGTFVSATRPQLVEGLSEVDHIAAGEKLTLARKKDGTIWAFGGSDSGLSEFGWIPSPRPTIVEGLVLDGKFEVRQGRLMGREAVRELSWHGRRLTAQGRIVDAGAGWTLAWIEEGTGKAPLAALAGDSGHSALAPFGTLISGGYEHSLMRRAENGGSVAAWGSNNDGELGLGDRTNRTIPQLLAGLSNVVAVSAGLEHSMAIRSDGSVWAWGRNANGQVGDGSGLERSSPVQVTGAAGSATVAGGGFHSLALKADGTLLSWGLNNYGQLGDNTQTTRLAPVPLASLASVVAVSAGVYHSLAVLSDGSVRSWGRNQRGQLGDNTNVDKPAPVVVTGLTGVAAVAGGQSHSLALKADGTVWTWGYNAVGQLGLGDNTQRLTPVQVPGLTGVAAIASRFDHNLALKSDGTVWAWGANTYGQLGDGGGPASRNTPFQVPGLTGIVAVAAGAGHSLALKNDGTLYSFGTNNAGQLGIGNTTDQPSPVATQPPGSAPALSLNRNVLRYGVRRSPLSVTPGQQVILRVTGGTSSWTITTDQPWLQVSPSSGTGTSIVTVSINTAALPAGTNATATVTVNAPGASNSPAAITCHLTLLTSTTRPIGFFDTPANNSTGIVGAIPVTGWALDDICVAEVKIWRDPLTGEPTHPNGLVYIGNSTFVPDARPDVEQLNPTLPLNYRGGWGYQMLTNWLPGVNGAPRGNGTYRIHAIATDCEGSTFPLGAKTITVDNANATKPFGTIDTPDQGETIAGSSYINFGWALTPLPHTIPVDGSTLWVVVDGAFLGNPVYNQYRVDIATFFPSYANSGGAVGYFFLNTTLLDEGIHSIAWSATDSAGRVEGLGSRYFFVFNSASATSAAPVAKQEDGRMAARPAMAMRIPAPQTEDDTAFAYRSGYDPSSPLRPLRLGGGGLLETLQVEESERLEIHLPRGSGPWEGALLVGGERRRLPVGSTFDGERGVFYWLVGPGFLGDYELEFWPALGAEPASAKLGVKVAPKGAGLQ